MLFKQRVVVVPVLPMRVTDSLQRSFLQLLLYRWRDGGFICMVSYVLHNTNTSCRGNRQPPGPPYQPQACKYPESSLCVANQQAINKIAKSLTARLIAANNYCVLSWPDRLPPVLLCEFWPLLREGTPMVKLAWVRFGSESAVTKTSSLANIWRKQTRQNSLDSLTVKIPCRRHSRTAPFRGMPGEVPSQMPVTSSLENVPSTEAIRQNITIANG